MQDDDITKENINEVSTKKKIFSKLKHFFSSKVFIAILSFTIGLLFCCLYCTVFATDHKKNDEKTNVQNSNFSEDKIWIDTDKKIIEFNKNFGKTDQFFDDFFNSSITPFEEISKMRTRMQQQFKHYDVFFNNQFDNWLKKHFSKTSQIKSKFIEDDNSISFIFEAAGIKKEDINISIKDELLIISGGFNENNNAIKNDEVESSFQNITSRFYRSIRLPQNIKKESLKIKANDGKIIVSFMKNHQEIIKTTDIENPLPIKKDENK